MVNWVEIDNNAKNWAREAGQFIRNSFSKKLEIQTKSNPNDLVTVIDKKTEKFFIEKIREMYPNHKIVGEEGFGDSISSMDGIVWVIDPIDGTMNFVHMQRNFAISIGIYEDGIGQIGLIYDVVLDELYHARRGHGAYLNEIQLAPLKKTRISEAIMGLNATWVTKNSRIDPSILGALVYDLRGTRSYGSAALEFAYVASGRLDGHISLRLSPWDFAAGKVLVEELGGIVTDLRGKPVDLLKQNSILMANPGIHEVVLENYLNNGNW